MTTRPIPHAGIALLAAVALIAPAPATAVPADGTAPTTVSAADSSAVSEPRTAPVRVTRAQLRSARVPSMCGHPRGRLVRGRLPGIDPMQGFVALGSRKQTALGRLTRSPRGDAVATVHCSGGGSDHDTWLLFYRGTRSGPRLRAALRLDDVTGWGREGVETIRIRKRTVRVGWLSGQPGEALCCGTAWWTARLRLKGTRVVVRSRTEVTELRTARRFIRAVNARNRKAARKVAPGPVVRRAFNETAGSPPMRVTGCGGHYSLPLRTRTCSTIFTRGPDASHALGLTLVHLKRGRWRVVEALRPE